jgi:hypothetical protein
VQAQEQRKAAAGAAASAPKPAAQQQVIPGDVASLETLELPESELPPGIPTLNLTRVAPLLPLVGGLNATVVASWVDVLEDTPPESLSLVVPALNNLSASTLEAVLAALPWLEWETVVAILPAVNAIPAEDLTKYIKLLQDVSGLHSQTSQPARHKMHRPGLSDSRLPAAVVWVCCVSLAPVRCQLSASQPAAFPPVVCYVP